MHKTSQTKKKLMNNFSCISTVSDIIWQVSKEFCEQYGSHKKLDGYYEA
jgi:hypothetical protein